MIMWSETLSNGKVRYVERFEHPLTGKQCKVSVTMDKDTRANRKQAQLALQDKISAKIDNLSVTLKKENLTLSELVDLYLEHQITAVKKSTYARNRNSTNSMKRILGEDVLIDRLTAGYVKKCLDEQHEKPGTTNERLTRFKAMMRWAYSNDYIKDIRWLDKLKQLKDEEKNKKLEDKYLEAEELTLLLNSMKIDKWRFLAELTALSGMRCGEAIALNTEDIDFENRIIHVTKTYDVVHKIITSTKTNNSTREIYMQDQLLQLCKDIKKFMAKERLQAGYRSDLFMSDVNGSYLEYPAYNKYLCTTAVKVLGREITTHYMRHTHVALLAEQGVPLEVISRRLGHSDSKITKRIYFHVTEKQKEKDNAQIKEVKIL